MKLRLMFLAAPLMISACSHTHLIQDTPESWYSYENVNKKLEGQGVTLLFSDSHMESVTIVSLGKDTTAYVEKSGGEIRRVPTSSLRHLQIESPATWDGAGLGAAIVGGGVLVIGIAVAATANTDFPVAPIVLAGTGAGVIVGGLVGLTIGSTMTSVDTYLLSSEEEK